MLSYNDSNIVDFNTYILQQNVQQTLHYIIIAYKVSSCSDACDSADLRHLFSMIYVYLWARL